ncbi:Dam family site-specific DNA-(adenine-N6)-methyltransferase [Methanococcoides sp. LMO-2]|uniref:site-specific DNA-methyltransferase (adenine-specific) n=1 Tax=Methanococcoides cohabitans TaxID=3136559 RepID=A0ABU9KPR6_9EURY
MSKTKPFLRWAGGKTKSVKILEKCIPSNFSPNNIYHEPFLGAGSLFFRLGFKNSILSDSNKDLIDCYKSIKERPDLISRYLHEHLKNNSESYYYAMRDKYNNSKPSFAKSALFIYLNKACFNGIYRVNKKGEFNVPYGFKEPPALPSKEEIEEIHRKLSNVKILHQDYKQIVNNTKRGDFVYFDPPYPSINGNSSFTHYTVNRFGQTDHEELAIVARELTKKGCYVLISNAYTPYIYSLYNNNNNNNNNNNFNFYELEVTRCIRADGQRHKVKEVAITNYDCNNLTNFHLKI